MNWIRPTLRRRLPAESPSVASLVSVLAGLAALLAVASLPAPVSARTHLSGVRDPAPPASVAPRNQREPSVVGTDNRALVGDTTVFPYSAIAAIEVYDDIGQLTETCTAAFVGPDAVLTAGHCLWDPETGHWASHVRVIPGKDGPLEPFGSQFATDWWAPDAFIASGGASNDDWGLIRLPDGHLAADAHWLPIAALSDAQLGADTFTPAVAGYPSDIGEGTMWLDSAPGLAIIDPALLWYAIDTGPGESGAPIWSSDRASPAFAQVAGIHTWAPDLPGGPNNGVRITSAVIADLREACRQIRCTLDVADPTEPSPARTYRAIGPFIARD